jgi:type II secretory pathway component GspD/PulD (secretin)
MQVMIEALVVETQGGALRDYESAAQLAHLGYDSGSGLVTYVDEAESILAALLWLVSAEKAVIKASPRVVAQEGKTATVKVSIEQYFEILSGRVGYEYTTLEAIEAAVALTITPRVALQDGTVTCEIVPEVGDVTGLGPNNLPIIARRTAATTIRVRDGEVIALGGLLQEITRETESKVPILGDLPLLGELFRSERVEKDQREIHILIVPHILDEDGRYRGPLLFERVNSLSHKDNTTPVGERWDQLLNENLSPPATSPQ